MLAVLFSPAVSAFNGWDNDEDAYYMAITYGDKDYTVGETIDVTVHVFNIGEYVNVDNVSLTIGFLGVFISVALGAVIGAVSGYRGGTFDMVTQRVIELLRAFPTLPLWMALSTRSACSAAPWGKLHFTAGGPV